MGLRRVRRVNERRDQGVEEEAEWGRGWVVGYLAGWVSGWRVSVLVPSYRSIVVVRKGTQRAKMANFIYF